MTTLLAQAKLIWPGLTNHELNIVLWSCTLYPLGTQSEVLAALKDAYSKSGGDLWIALQQADDAIMTARHGL